MMEEERIFKITETQINEILHYIKSRSTLAIKNLLNQLEEIKENGENRKTKV